MMNQRICAFAFSMLVPAALVAGCAKRTVTADVSAPPRAAAPVPPRSVTAAAPESPVTPLAEITTRSEEHTSELQSQSNLVCRLLLEKITTQHGSPDKKDEA